MTVETATKPALRSSDDGSIVQDDSVLAEMARRSNEETLRLDQEIGRIRMANDRLRHTQKLREAEVIASGGLAGRNQSEKEAHLLLFMTEEEQYASNLDLILSQREEIASLEAWRDYHYRSFLLALELLGRKSA